MLATLRTLLVEDEPVDAALIERVLKRAGFDVALLRVESAEEVRGALAAQTWDVVIADFALPRFRGTETLGILKEMALDVPLIIVSGAIDANTAYAAMKVGARDYILKDDLGRLPAVVSREVEEAAQRAARRLAESERDTALESLRASHALAQALHRIDQTLHSTLQLDEVLQRVLDDGMEALSVDAGAIRVGDDWACVVHCPHRESALDAPSDRDDLPCLALASDAREALADEPYGVSSTTLVCPSGARSVMVAPLTVRDRAIGRLFFCAEERARSFTEDEADFARKLGASLSLAVANAQLFDDIQGRARLDATLIQINETIHSSFNIDEILQRIVREAAVGLGCTSAAIALLGDGGTWSLGYSHGLPEAERHREMDAEQCRYVEALCDSRSPLAVEDAFADDCVDGEQYRPWGMRAVLAMPLFLRSMTFGVIFFDYGEPRRFSQAEEDFAQHLGASLSLAIENARVYQGERRIAEMLQEAILSLPESIPGLNFAHVYHSATETAKVGGDFYDLFELGNGLLGVTMGDISGKGLDAAVLMSFVKNAIRSHAMLEDSTPADVLAWVNTMLYKKSRSEEFATVFFGLLDRRNGRLEYCNAGHPACAIVRTDCDVVGLVSNSPILGAFADARFANAEVTLRWDDLVFLYTDGLIEARSEGGMFGEAGLFKLLKQVCESDTVRVVEQVLERVVAFGGGRLSDDVAALAMTMRTNWA